MRAKEYTIRVEWSEEDGCYVSHVIGPPGTPFSVAAHGDSEIEALYQCAEALAGVCEVMLTDDDKLTRD